MPSVGKWIDCGINRQWNNTSLLKRNELSRPKKTWRNLKCVLLSERSESEKSSYCMIPAI